MPEKHSRTVPGGRAFWRTERLWELSADLPVEEVSIDSIPEFDADCWFGGRAPSCREVAEHTIRINKADLAYPIILAADGTLMDGGHRVAKAYTLGRSTIAARRFHTTPEPDWIVPADERP